MAPQHLPRDLVRSISGLEELAHTMKNKHFHLWKEYVNIVLLIKGNIFYSNYHANIKVQQRNPIFVLSYNKKETTLLKKCLTCDNESTIKR